jgi:hypothetical protein
VDLNPLLQTDLEEELRIEERRRALRLEKTLMFHHGALSRTLDELRRHPRYDASEPLEAALWCLSAAVCQIVRSD